MGLGLVIGLGLVLMIAFVKIAPGLYLTLAVQIRAVE